MNMPRIAILCLAFVACLQCVRAQDTPSAAAVSEMQKWIATTDEGWQAVFKRDVTDLHLMELEKLKQQYVAALEAAVTKASSAGDLDGAVALRNEEKRFAGTNLLPEQDEAADAATVKQIRAAVRGQIVKLEKDTATRTKALHAKYDTLLADAQARLTQAQRLEDALLVKAKREEVAAAWLAGISAVQTPATPPPSTPAPATVKQPSPKPAVPAPAVAIAPEAEAVGGNLFQNPNFESGTDGWKISAWGKTGTMTVDKTEVHNGKPTLRVENPTPQHTLVNQKVAVKPKTRYLLTAFIKTKDVEPPKKGQKEGAELMVTGGWRRSTPVSNTSGWTKVSYTLTTLDGETEMVVGMSLGHYGATVKGAAWFSDLSLTELGHNAKK